MKKIFLFLFLFFISVSSIFSAETKLEITNISYIWNLSDKTIINITWKNFLNCTDIFYDGKIIPITQVNSTKIDFNFSNLNSYSWKITLNCWWKSYPRDFNFPYINKLKYNPSNIDRALDIEWINLNWAIVFLSWWTFTKEYNWITNIKWKISETLLWTEVYVKLWSLSSNIVNLDLTLPKINYVYSEKWINDWNDIYVYWSNLNFYENLTIFLWKNKITEFKLLDNWNTIKFNTLGYVWDKDLYVVSNGFKSNVIKLFIYWKKPTIDNVSFESKEWLWKQLFIYWENYYKDTLITEVYINWKKTTIWQIFDWYISIPSTQIAPWIQIDIIQNLTIL